MKPLALLLILVTLLFTACAPAATSQTSEVSATSEVLPSPTPRPTQTPEPTATVKPLGLPESLKALLPKDLPDNWKATQDGETWYIVDAKTQEAVLRSSPDGKKWQARFDVTTDNGIFEGWITDQGHADVLDGKNVRMDLIKITTQGEGLDYNLLPIPYGYMTDYTVVEITDGNETMDVVFFETVYFYSNGTELRIKFMADKKLVERNGDDIRKHLGKFIGVTILTPQGDEFSENFITTVSDRNHMSDIQVEVALRSSSWVKAYDLLAKLQNSTTGILDLEGLVLVDLLGE